MATPLVAAVLIGGCASQPTHSTPKHGTINICTGVTGPFSAGQRVNYVFRRRFTVVARGSVDVGAHLRVRVPLGKIVITANGHPAGFADTEGAVIDMNKGKGC